MISVKRSLLFCSGLFLSLSLQAADTTPTNTAGIKKIFPGAFSSFELKNKQEREVGEKKFKGKTEAEYVIGSSFYDEKFNAALTTGLELKESSTVLKYAGTAFDMSLKAYGNDYYKLFAIAGAGFPGSGDTDVSVYVGGSHGLGYELETAAGEFSFEVGHSLVGLFGDKAGKVPVLGKDGKGLTDKDSISAEDRAEMGMSVNDDGKIVTEQKNPSLSQGLALEAEWKPNMVAGLSLKIERSMSWSHNPKVEYDTESKNLSRKVRSFLPDYGAKMGTPENSMSAKYEFNKDSSWAKLGFVFTDADADNKREYAIKTSIGVALL